MALTLEERNELYASLNALIPQKFSQLLFVLNIPKGIVPPPSAPQGDRVHQLLTWAEAEDGCELIVVKQALHNVLSKRKESQSGSSSVSKPFLEILENGSMRVWDIKTESWCEFPANVTFITSEVSSLIIQNPQYAKTWKRVHTLTEKLYPQYIKLHHYMLLCQKLSELQSTNDAEQYRFDAATFFERIRFQSESFGRELSELARDNPVELLFLLSSVPVCSSAISQSLGLRANGPVFENGISLIERISELLLQGLHVADKLLEIYFADATA